LIDQEIKKANASLEKVKLFRRGKHLTLRGTFPPKPGDGDRPKQYIISIGLPATQEGVKLAKAKAQKLEAELIYERWDWSKIDKTTPLQPENTVEKLVTEFENYYWQTRQKTVNREKNYQDDYLQPFLYLPQDEPISGDLLKKALLTLQPDSRQRLRFAVAYGALAKFAGISIDLSQLKGNYQPSTKRNIPSDFEIERYWESIPNPAWRWVLGIIAAFGIRPHEIFWLNTSRLDEYPPILIVQEPTKTGYRLVYPLPNEAWVQKWQLHQRQLPKIATEGKSNRELGAKISQGFNRYQIPSPYHFRDAYAIRGEILNVNPATVAQWMGHSLEVHYKKYLTHINERHFNEAWKKINQSATNV
jgi:integrase